jgi:hypothetical protein
MAASHICLSGVRLLFLIPTLSVGSMVGNASTARIARDPKLKFERWMNGGDPGSYGIDLSPRIQCARDGKTAHPLRLFA